MLVVARRRRRRGAAARRAPARECDGLLVCIPVAGPWVQVYGGATPTYYQLSCPGRGQVIGGLDADRAGPLGITFLGNLGGPVGPGVTTAAPRSSSRRTTRALSGFRPLLGCIPASGGGGRGADDLRAEAEAARRRAPPVDATIRRVKNVRLKDGQSERLSHACLAGERVLAFSTAVAFRTRRPPSLAALGSVRATARRAGRPRRRQRALRDHAAAGTAGRGADPRRLRRGPS